MIPKPQILPIKGKTKDGVLKYIATGFIIECFREKYLVSAGHVFNTIDYDQFFYEINNISFEISLETLKYESENKRIGREKGYWIGVKDDYAFLKIETDIEGIKLNSYDPSKGENVRYCGFNPVNSGNQAEYIERIGISDSAGYIYTGFEGIQHKVVNMRRVLVEGCVVGNSGGPILREDSDSVIGILTNGSNEDIIYITSDHLLEKLIDHYKLS